ncbi:MAG: maltose alpha-D-glucosyltransferase, partial [Candidatus Dormibacteraeota bacterium]|nr:maltose alpha-D-glucosyltransferase [Candidatus Dormibacteraeota bacterium]
MRRRNQETSRLEDDPLWYKDALIYELHVRAFNDTTGDGSGDFRGLVEKLPYLQDLGVSAIWLLPFYPSPLRDDGYDIADYTDVNPMFGNLGDVTAFVKEAHHRGMRVITELVCNHTSDQHPWFQRARRAKKGSAARDFYVWSDTNQKYQDARIIFKDFETSNWTWDHVAGQYYWHRFYSHQPDLNYDNPKVKEALLKALDFWLDMGIDGVRLDAVPYLYEREGTNGENLPETHEFLKEMRRHVDAHYSNRMLLAEANQWPEDAVTYFGAGDECHMSFHFPLMPRLFMSIRMEDRFPIIDILAQTPAIPDNSQWALFLRNHDELTLEMVTDEERDYMYRAYTQDRLARLNLGIRRRLAPLLGNDRRRIELMNGLLFSLPGTPVLYYGDEIGMGDNIFLGDRNGVRTPMQWSADRNAGFSRANRQRLYLPVITDPEYHYETVNVEAQAQNPHSMLSWMKRLIALRKRHRAFGRGTLELLRPENRKVLAYVRRYESEQILCLANLSRFLQAVELDLSKWKGLVPVELFSSNEMPVVGDAPYFLTLGPHAFYWFSLQPRATPNIVSDGAQAVAAVPEMLVPSTWLAGGLEAALTGPTKERLESILLGYIRNRRWFAGKARRLKSAQISDLIPVPGAAGGAVLAAVVIAYAEGDPETYQLPLAYANPAEAPHILERWPHSALAWVRVQGEEARGLVYDALGPPAFAEAVLGAIARRRRATGGNGTLIGTTTRAFNRLRGPETIRLEAALSVAEQSNNSVVFGERLILKVFRRLEEGVNPELELGRFLTEKTNFSHIAPLAGSLEYRRASGEPISLAVLQGYVPNQGDAWQYTL